MATWQEYYGVSFLPRDCIIWHYSAKRGHRLHVVRLSVRLWRWWIRITQVGNLGN